MAKKVTHEPIPQTDSIDQLARFWDLHDVTDYEDELELVEEPIFEPSGDELISIRLPASNVARIRSIAAARGVSSAVLLRDWVLEKLANP